MNFIPATEFDIMALLEQDYHEFLEELHTVRDVLRWSVTKFEQNGLFYGHGTDNAWDEAIVLLQYYCELPSENFAHVLDASLTTSDKQELYHMITTRINERMPLPYITNEAWFANMAFYVDERVLIPRSPVAELIQNSFEPYLSQKISGSDSSLNILEIGTGSGCIACAIADHFINQGIKINIDATDISDKALAVAYENVTSYGLEPYINLIKSDLFNSLEKKQYDLIISNPPYVDAAEMSALPPEYLHEPRNALAAGTDGLYLVDIMLKQAADYLTDDGVFIVEVGASKEALNKKYPDVAFTWLEFAHGGDGVFLLTKQQLEYFK